MKISKLKQLTIAAAILFAGNAFAVPVTQWNVLVDTKFDTASVLPTPGVDIISDTQLEWGTATTSGRSSLEITNTPSSETVDTDGAAVANVSITHANNPIIAPSLTSVNILSTLTLTPVTPFLPGQIGPVTVTFGINFLETPNGDAICDDGGVNGTGVNINGCADIFVISQDSLNFPFTFDGEDYFISFFELTSGLNPLSDAACTAVIGSTGCLGFLTPELETTTFQFASVITTEPVSVPEPSTLALMGLALFVMGFSQRRKA